MKYMHPHTVYLVWGYGDRPLYVGMTHNLTDRLRNHRRNHRKGKALWWSEWVAIDCFAVANWHAAKLLEVDLIWELDPVYNQIRR